jgi:hypothetical protein
MDPRQSLAEAGRLPKRQIVLARRRAKYSTKQQRLCVCLGWRGAPALRALTCLEAGKTQKNFRSEVWTRLSILLN